MHAFKQTAWVILSVFIIGISLVTIIMFSNGIDVGKMLREHRKTERAEQLKLYEQQIGGVKLDFWERCSKQGHLCSEETSTDGTRRTKLNPWVEMKNEASNLTFGWSDDKITNHNGDYASTATFSGPIILFSSDTGQDVPINRYDASK